MFRLYLLLLLSISATNSSGQTTIWQENFDGYLEGTTTGDNNNGTNPAVDWISGGCLSCPDSLDDWWEVRQLSMQARDVNHVSFLQTEVIDISNYTNVQFSLDVVECGDLEGPYFGTDDCTDQTNEDYVNVLYRVDNGSWILLENYLNWCGLYSSCTHTLFGDDGENSGDCRTTDQDWDSVRVMHGGIQGATLEIRLELINSSDEELISIDNILVQGSLVLPIKLASFHASAQEQGVLLEWTTSYERNNAFFQLERSAPGFENISDWKVLFRTPGASLSLNSKFYHYFDTMPPYGNNYYRLKQVDMDGGNSYSDILLVRVMPTIKIFPNPLRDYLYLQGSLPDREEQPLILYNSRGQTQQLTAHRQQQYWTAYIGDLPNGWYYLTVLNEPVAIRRFILIQH